MSPRRPLTYTNSNSIVVPALALNEIGKVLDNDAGSISNLGKKAGGSEASEYTKLSNTLMQLRKISSHPWLLPGAEPESLNKNSTVRHFLLSQIYGVCTFKIGTVVVVFPFFHDRLLSFVPAIPSDLSSTY